MKYRWIAVGGVCLVAVAFAQSAYRLIINGRTAEGSAIVVKGEVYIPLKALQSAGVKATVGADGVRLTLPTGGSDQSGAVEGTTNEWLFNGVWRFRVTSVDKLAEGNGWGVNVELRNGTKTDNLALDGTGFDSLKLVLNDGTLLDAYNAVDMRSKGFPQGAGEKFTLIFNVDDPGSKKPDKLILLIKPDADLRKYMHDSLKATYTVPDPSFRVKL